MEDSIGWRRILLGIVIVFLVGIGGADARGFLEHRVLNLSTIESGQ